MPGTRLRGLATETSPSAVCVFILKMVIIYGCIGACILSAQAIFYSWSCKFIEQSISFVETHTPLIDRCTVSFATDTIIPFTSVLTDSHERWPMRRPDLFLYYFRYICTYNDHTFTIHFSKSFDLSFHPPILTSQPMVTVSLYPSQLLNDRGQR